MWALAGSAAKWDLILFNSGLHNLNNSTIGLAAYKTQLSQIVARRVSPPQACLGIIHIRDRTEYWLRAAGRYSENMDL